MSLTPGERETVINYNDGEDIAYIYTAQRKVITRLRRNVAAELVEEGEFEGSVWARFRLPARLVSFRAPRIMSEEQRAAAGVRLAAARRTR